MRTESPDFSVPPAGGFCASTLAGRRRARDGGDDDREARGVERALGVGCASGRRRSAPGSRRSPAGGVGFDCTVVVTVFVRGLRRRFVLLVVVARQHDRREHDPERGEQDEDERRREPVPAARVLVGRQRRADVRRDDARAARIVDEHALAGRGGDVARAADVLDDDLLAGGIARQAAVRAARPADRRAATTAVSTVSVSPRRRPALLRVSCSEGVGMACVFPARAIPNPRHAFPYRPVTPRARRSRTSRSAAPAGAGTRCRRRGACTRRGSRRRTRRRPPPTPSGRSRGSGPGCSTSRSSSVPM